MIPKATTVEEPQMNLESVLKNIYQNLIDEDDIILEEESKDGISHGASHITHTGSLSEIQFLQHNSNLSNITGHHELRKLVKLIKNNSVHKN